MLFMACLKIKSDASPLERAGLHLSIEAIMRLSGSD